VHENEVIWIKGVEIPHRATGLLGSVFIVVGLVTWFQTIIGRFVSSLTREPITKS
jgi:hypothetical protein